MNSKDAISIKFISESMYVLINKHLNLDYHKSIKYEEISKIFFKRIKFYDGIYKLLLFLMSVKLNQKKFLILLKC